jgi:hypothetical protein
VMRAMARLSPLLRTHDGAYVPVPVRMTWHIAQYSFWCSFVGAVKKCFSFSE